MNRKEAMHTLKDIFDYFWIEIEEKRMDEEITEIMEVLESPLTLADLLGWEEDVEYDYKDLYVLKVENNRLFMKSEKCSSGWCNFALFPDEIEDLQQATKVERKLKAYHVKDRYSYDCLMEELEEQGYKWNSSTEPTDSSYWDIYENNTVIYCRENKRLIYSSLDYFNACRKNSYNLIEYYKEEPKYYAKIKGWELYGYNNYYWNYYIEDALFVDYKCENEHYKTKFTKTEWNELGINDSNADWEKVAE